MAQGRYLEEPPRVSGHLDGLVIISVGTIQSFIGFSVCVNIVLYSLIEVNVTYMNGAASINSFVSFFKQTQKFKQFIYPLMKICIPAITAYYVQYAAKYFDYVWFCGQHLFNPWAIRWSRRSKIICLFSQFVIECHEMIS